MSEFTCLLGGFALSDFRKRKLQRLIERVTGAGCSVEARHVYLAESARVLAENDIRALERLLQGDRVDGLETGGLLLVVPRMGTQSPWSTKATDIARSMVKEYGMSSNLGQVYFAHKKQGQFLNPTQEGSGDYSAMTAHLIDKEIRQIIDKQYERALEILRSKRTILNRTAESLIESETIQGEELAALEAAVSNRGSGLADLPGTLHAGDGRPARAGDPG